MRPTCSARSLASLSRCRQPVPSIPNRLLHSSPRLCSEVVPSPSIAADSSSTSSTTPASSSSSSTPTPAWPRPVPEGKIEAYDLALEFLRSRQVELEVKRTDPTIPKRLIKGVDSMPIPVHDPEVRWKWEQGLAEPTLASSKYFERERFELGGGLDLHEARINQMHVVPDVAMVSKLELDFGFKFPVPPPPPAPEPDKFGLTKKVRPYHTRDPKDGNRIICGALLTVKETLSQPELEIRQFGDECKSKDRYTLMLLDIDVPDTKTHSFQEKIHWLVPNLTIDPSTRIFPSPDIPLSPSAKHVSPLPEPLHAYLPPHPHMGTDYHRYTFLLLRHNGPIQFGSKGVPIPPRDGFNYRKWAASLNKKHKVKVAGMSFFRENYDPVVCPQIWKELICEPELKFVVDNQSNRLYLDRWGNNKADVLNKKKVFEARQAANALLSAEALALAKADRRDDLASQGLGTSEIDTIEAEEEAGVWQEQVFAEDDSTVANATGEKKIVSAVVQVETEKPVESSEEAEKEMPVLRRWRRGVSKAPRGRSAE